MEALTVQSTSNVDSRCLKYIVLTQKKNSHLLQWSERKAEHIPQIMSPSKYIKETISISPHSSQETGNMPQHTKGSEKSSWYEIY